MAYVTAGRELISDRAIGAQVTMLAFERRQYETVIGRELDAIQVDVVSPSSGTMDNPK